MTTTKEGGGRGEREREKERERERVKSRETLFCWSRQNWWEKREGRGGDGVNDVVNALLLPSLEERGSERQNETGLGCSRSRKSPRKMNLLISLVLVHAGGKEFVSKRRAKKNKEKRRKFLTHKQNKRKRRTNKKETTETRNWPNTFLSFITQHTLLLLLLLLLNNNNRHRQHEQHGGHPRIGRREDAVLHLERREQQRHLSKPSQGGGRRVRESLGFTKEGVSESFGRAQSWTRRESEEVEKFWFCVLRERERERDWLICNARSTKTF